VRETWCDAGPFFGEQYDPPHTIGYRATETACNINGDPVDTYAFNWGIVKWRPSIHMPRWASRLTLEITSVHVERLQDISEEDAKDEGVKPFPYNPEGDCWTARGPGHDYRNAFEYLWGEINGWDGSKAWAANPWLWVIGFKPVEEA